ncbi:MAG: glycosyl transferase [Butyrivibrio sp.]|nr:glycosyl transferase [Butyrivibrio sp.]
MKHAYLIIAHNQFYLLKELVGLLQDDNNDIYVHLDKKANLDELKDVLGRKMLSDITIIQKHSVTWGGHSQINCEMTLLKKALDSGNNYDYLHIISGVDLPIKPIKYINDFFEQNNGKEFLYFDLIQDKENILSRCNEYHFFQEILGRTEKGFLFDIERFFISFQKRIGIRRSRNIEQYLGKGANWVSITSDFAKYVVSKEYFIKKYFWYSRCADEVFMHTLFKMSPFSGNLFDPIEKDGIRYTNMVYTDWDRGKPYTMQDEDLAELVSSPYLFARKFDERISIEKLKELIK